MELIDPAPRQRVSGQIDVTRSEDVRSGDRRLAVLTINPGKSELRMTETDDRGQVFGTVRPKGEIRYVLGENYIQSAVMDSEVRVEAMPKDSPLTKATFVEEA